MCDCIIPPDSDPGAEWAQVVNYIDLQLCGPLHDLRQRYREGIANLEATAQTQFGKPFASLVAAKQNTILTELEGGTSPKDIWTTVRPNAFFELVLAHTMQGYYGDPRHGGNRDRISWRMLGLSYPQVRGRFRTDVPEPKSL